MRPIGIFAVSSFLWITSPASHLPVATGFTLNVLNQLFSPPPAIKPDLLDIAERQQGVLLRIRLDIGDTSCVSNKINRFSNSEYDGDDDNVDAGGDTTQIGSTACTPGKSSSRMTVTDLIVELHHDHITDDCQHTHLPGADGKHKRLSSGHRRLDIVKEGHYINMLGTQHVHMDKACFEMVWRKDKPSGTLVCGFAIPHEYRRNEAHLPEGEMYISFPLWTEEGLHIGQQEKEKVHVEMEKYLIERDEALEKYEVADNPIMRAYHIQCALGALDKYNNIDHQTLDTIPMYHQILHIQDDLLLAEKGLIWSKTNEGHALLGEAFVSSVSNSPNSRLMP